MAAPFSIDTELSVRDTFVFLMALGALLTAYGASDFYSAGGAGKALMSSFLPQYSPELKMMQLSW
ncbi:MAG: hypothetical protein PF489_00900 [Salinivirgaceae bacterium]|nr:hypothetical protein [Salinivirgaceae bacterium]